MVLLKKDVFHTQSVHTIFYESATPSNPGIVVSLSSLYIDYAQNLTGI